MLKRLELIGFKSFADRTVFDFAPGISAIVGPNGSGKSNVVDAVRWILGEQSPRSLRGGEMTDVIFNGSSSRKSLGMAEATMTFDNQRRELSRDADEVRITRRVYRDGRGEYLLDGQPSRLKEIKDLFLGSGAGHGAYSVIEQGRVDALLAASTKDRRAVFEEAAGISRFKQKKLETLRKLEHVDSDLLRIADLLAELEKRLATLRVQSAKAIKHQELSERFRELRLAASASEFAELTGALDRELSALAELPETGSGVDGERQAQLARLDAALAELHNVIRSREAEMDSLRRQASSEETAFRIALADESAGITEQLASARRCAELRGLLGVLDADEARAVHEKATLARRLAESRAESARTAAAVAEAAARLAALVREIGTARELFFDISARAARLRGETENHRLRRMRLRAETERKRSEAAKGTAHFESLNHLLSELARSDEEIKQRLGEARQVLDRHHQERDRLRRQEEEWRQRLAELGERRASLRGRVDVLEAFERSYEGFDLGVKELIERLRAGDPLLTGVIFGPIADLLTVESSSAALVDLALGPAAQHFVVRDSVTIDRLLQSQKLPAGRVGFLPLDTEIVSKISHSPPAFSAPLDDPFSLSGSPIPFLETVPDRPQSAASLARCDQPGLEALPRRLLGATLVVETLAAARQAARTHATSRFIARTGEILEPDGTVILGTSTSVGLVSRKSELRTLSRQLQEIDTTIQTTIVERDRIHQRLASLEPVIRDHRAAVEVLSGEAGTVRERLLEQRRMLESSVERMERASEEARLLEQELTEAEAAERLAESAAENAQSEGNAIKESITFTERSIATMELHRDELIRADTAAQVAHGTLMEQASGLDRILEELTQERRRRMSELESGIHHQDRARLKQQEAQLAALRASAQYAITISLKEERERSRAEAQRAEEHLHQERTRLAAEMEERLRTFAAASTRRHEHELAASTLRARRDEMVRRVQEELGTSIESTCVNADFDRAQAESEIADLRTKLARLGGANPEALEELATVEKRERELRTQYDDLVASRDKLRRIIDQIDNESRKSFTELFGLVRTRFQELFRKLFGGGAADLVLDEENDPLESGVDIVARPPGKETQRISLLSGGERALTAVALLLALFHVKPSPFCLLDEIDAAMDEANTQRLAAIVKEFSDKSQFIVITHKKRTMAVADVLYGVTMRESGISVPVSVRFEDWPEESARAA